MEAISRSFELENGDVVSLEFGKLARQADGSVWLSVGDTRMLATVVARKEINPLVDFLPLSVDYKENYSSTGKFPGGFFKRDGRLNEYEILTSRIVDRTLRPMFPKDYHGDIQVIITVFSNDKVIMPDAYACLAASSALMASDIPFPDPVCVVRVIYKDGQYKINPTFEEVETAELELMVAGSEHSINMVEGEAKEVSEEVMIGALKVAHEQIIKLCNWQKELRALVGKPTRSYEVTYKDEAKDAELRAYATPLVKDIFDKQLPKQERSAALKELKSACVEKFHDPEHERAAELELSIKQSFEDIVYNTMRAMILDKNVRIDGRTPEQIRPIYSEVGLLPRTHGSSLFTRGETQALATVTLGTKMDEQTIDYATREGSKKFMLQYSFPPFSTGEVKMLRAPSRREVGHGNLAERALRMVVPSDLDYTVRVTSDVLESNGSSSMATVCSGTMALMDAGIRISAPVSGIAMGLIMEGDKYAVLSDILGDEDHLGDMDFKVTGTPKGITACQMDIKIRGLSYEILSKALYQAKQGREHILSKMVTAISQPREDYSAFAPRLVKLTIPQDTIGAVIGPGGKVIQEIQRTTGTVIVIEEYDNAGHVTISSPNREALDAAADRIKAITYQPEEGEVFEGLVKGMKESGAFVEFLPGKEGWLHISEVAYERIPTIEDAIKIGDRFPVKLIEVDKKAGKFRLSRKAMMPKPEGYVEPPARERSSDRGDRRGGRDDRRGGRDDRRGGRDDRRGRDDRGPRGDRGPREDRGGERREPEHRNTENND